MWHEARKQERKIRGMMVDYRRRAERRRDFYERIKADPTQFLQLHGRQCKIHLDPAVASSANSPAAMMPWQGQKDNLIDRFDVRAHLDFISPVKDEDEEDLTYEERQINYERYRIIAQNSFLCISEEKFLKQLHMEEQFGYTEPETKKKKSGGAAIGFNYEDGTSVQASVGGNSEENSDDNSDSDLDVDLYINVSKVDQHQAHELNKHGLSFGMSSNDFYSFLTDDMEEAESNRLAREEEHEKALFSGRKSRRERRAHREKRLANRVISPPSYAARSSPTYPSFRDSKSVSRSPSPENTGKITYITSFGGDDEVPTTSTATYADKVKSGGKFKRSADVSHSRRTTASRKRSRSSDRRYKRKRRSRSTNSRSPRPRHRSRSRRRSRSYDRYRRSPHSKDRQRKYRPRRSSSSSSSDSSSSSSRRSRSKTRNNRARSPSSSSLSNSSSSRSRSKFPSPPKKIVNKSKSPSVKRESPPKLAVQRYYGRKRSDYSSSSSLEDLSEKEESPKVEVNSPTPIENKSLNSGNAVSTFKKSSATSVATNNIPTSSSNVLSLQERLKRKRQALLNKQFRADKLAEQLKSEREKQEQQNREDELREMAIKLRRRQREIRHAYDSNSSDSSSDSEDRKSNISQRGTVRSRSISPIERKTVQESPKFREQKNRDRDRSRDRTEWRDREFRGERRSPKSGEGDRRSSYYREEGSSSSRSSTRRDVKKEDYKRDVRDYRSSRRDEPKGGRSLVDY